MPAQHRISRLAAGAALAVTATLTFAPASVAAPVATSSQSGGASLTPTAATVQGTSAPFTIGLSASSAPAGDKLTISGLANARAGVPLTIVSNAISSAKRVEGAPAITTPTLAEGTYRATVLIPRATKAGTYAILLRASGRQVASTSLRVTPPGRASSRGNSGRGTARAGTSHKIIDNGACAGIGFTVLHDDRAAGVAMPAGAYRITSPNLDCSTASTDFTAFLERDGRAIAGWTVSGSDPGHATYRQKSTGLRFTVAEQD